LADMHRLHRGEITEMLWPGLDQRAAANNLHKVLHVARRVLEPSLPGNAASSYLQFNGELVALTIADVWIDISEFHTAAQIARSSRDLSALRAALALYGGELLPE